MKQISERQAVKFIVFISGAIVMGVEIVASRLLAPYYGDTVYTWGSLIAVIMMALAIGYRKGGKNADSYISYLVFSNLILKAGITKEVVLSSAINIIEIWDKESYEKVLEETAENFADLAEEVMGDDEELS